MFHLFHYFCLLISLRFFRLIKDKYLLFYQSIIQGRISLHVQVHAMEQYHAMFCLKNRTFLETICN